MKINALIVDDERLARKALRGMLDQFDFVEITGEAATVGDALRLVEETAPDVIFLDIHMPGSNGFELVHHLEAAPFIVFVTAYDQHAVRAFDVQALDYLLKPVRRERLAASLERVNLALTKDAGDVGLRYDDRLWLTLKGQQVFLPVCEISFIKAADSYSEIAAIDGRTGLAVRSLKSWEMVLPKQQFTRVHRSAIVNIGQVERLEKQPGYNFLVYMKGFEWPLMMSRRHGHRLKHRFE